MKKLTILVFVLSSIAGISSAQDFIWAKSIGGTGSTLNYSIALDYQNNVITTGNFTGTTDFDPGNGINNLFTTFACPYILKLDSNGDLLWVRQLIPSLVNPLYTGVGRAVKTDGIGNIYITGVFSGTLDFDPGAGVYTLTSTGNKDAFILKLNINGDLVWAKKIGGTGNDEGTRLYVSQTGTVYITGMFENTVDFDPGIGVSNITSSGGNDVFLLSLDSSGNFLWASGIGNSNNNFPIGLYVDNDQNVITGFSGNGNRLFKYNNSGNLVWSKNMCTCDIVSIGVDNSNNIYCTGLFSGTQDFDPGIAVFNMTPVNSVYNGYILKLDQDGNFIWSKQLSGFAMGSSINNNNSGVITLTGTFYETTDFDPGTDTYNLTPTGTNGYADIFVAQLDNSGNFLSAVQFKGNGPEQNTGTSTSSSGDILIAGFFINTVDFDPGPATYNLVSNSTSGFIIKLHSALKAKNEETSPLALYPNPVINSFTISSPKLIHAISITDMLGRVVYKAEPENYLNIVEIDVAQGIYHVSIHAGDEVVVIKVVKL